MCIISPRRKKAWLVTDISHLLALTVNFISHVGFESSAHSEDVWSIRSEVTDRSHDDERDLLCRLSLTVHVLNVK